MAFVAISAGHARYVRGAAGVLDEVDEARRVCNAVVSELKQIGVAVQGPFFDDTSSSQSQNLDLIVNWHNAQKGGPGNRYDVSVHFNAYVETDAPMGCEVLFVSQGNLARTMSKAIAAAGGFIDRGPKHRTNLKFLNATQGKSILLEICFVDSTADAALYREHFTAICHAIMLQLAEVAGHEPRPPEAEPATVGEQPPVTEPPRPTLTVGDEGAYVVAVQQLLGLPADGDFGAVSEAAVAGFQAAEGDLQVDGVVGEQTWAALDRLHADLERGSYPLDERLDERIDTLAARQPALTTYSWPERGTAPVGFYAGLGKTFAIALDRLAQDDEAAKIMAAADSQQPDTDALSWYVKEFAGLEMDNSQAGPETLRHLFVLIAGLAMRESSGNPWEGRDLSATNVESDTAEAGLLQASWNLSSASATIGALFDEYLVDPNGLRMTFAAEFAPTDNDLENFGTGDGASYQWLAKYCPDFALLMGAVGLRLRRQHWGPLNRSEVTLNPLVDDYLLEVATAVERTNSV